MTSEKLKAENRYSPTFQLKNYYSLAFKAFLKKYVCTREYQKYKIKVSQNFQANKTKKIQSSISEEKIKEEKLAARRK